MELILLCPLLTPYKCVVSLGGLKWVLVIESYKLILLKPSAAKNQCNVITKQRRKQYFCVHFTFFFFIFLRYPMTIFSKNETKTQSDSNLLLSHDVMLQGNGPCGFHYHMIQCKSPSVRCALWSRCVGLHTSCKVS